VEWMRSQYNGRPAAPRSAPATVPQATPVV
jgi:hypothetical protein